MGQQLNVKTLSDMVYDDIDASYARDMPDMVKGADPKQMRSVLEYLMRNEVLHAYRKKNIIPEMIQELTADAIITNVDTLSGMISQTISKCVHDKTEQLLNNIETEAMSTLASMYGEPDA